MKHKISLSGETALEVAMDIS